MYKKSLTGGTVDAKKVSGILKVVLAQKPTHPVKILKTYKRLIENALNQETVVVESASKIPNQSKFEKQLRGKTAARRIIYKTNPSIVVGAKITHGDWIYDDTLDAKLQRLTMND